MFHNLFAFILLLICVAPIYAQIYKCEDEEGVSYSKRPCENQFINLEVNDALVEERFIQQEQLITPVYPDWKSGWKKIKDLKLERFFEVVYTAQKVTDLNQSTRINIQKLTNLPQSMNILRFASSVEDIIDSACINALHLQSTVGDNTLNGQYLCSYRRDSEQGELGYYKIMRGENNIYMVTVKWEIEPFEIEGDKTLAIMTDQQQNKINMAQKYLQNQVKLCRTGNCL